MKNRACPACKAVGRDSNDDHLFLMQGGDRWACSKNNDVSPPHPPYFEDVNHKPLTGFSNPLQNFSTAAAVNKPVDMAAIKNLTGAAIREIPKDIVDFYGVKVEHDQATGQQVKHYYPITSDGKLVTYKVRTLPKTFFNLHTNDQLPNHLDMFGTNTLSGVPSTGLIAEGQLDAMAVFSMLINHKVQNVRCLSVPNGANLVAVKANIELLRKVPNLYYCPDNDAVGLALVPEIAKLLPGIRIVEYSEKDAELMLRKGKSLEFYNAFRRAQPYKPASVVSTTKLKDEAMKPVQFGLSYPFATLTKKTYGLALRRLIGIGAGPGTGKTVLAQSLIQHIVYIHKMKAGVFALEEQPAESLRRMAGHIMKLPIHLPGINYDPRILSQVMDTLDGLLFYYDHSGYRDWQDVEEAMRFMAMDGVKFFFIDPISALHTHLGAGDANQFLNKAMFEMSRMIHELEITIFHINHLNNPDGGKDHNEGGMVKASQFTGSRSQWRFSTDVWGLSRDATNSDVAVQNLTTFSILKNRLSGELGSFQIRYNHQTGTLEEPPLSTNF